MEKYKEIKTLLVTTKNCQNYYMNNSGAINLSRNPNQNPSVEKSTSRLNNK